MTGRRMMVWDGEKTQDLWGHITPFPTHLKKASHKKRISSSKLRACSKKYPCYRGGLRKLLLTVIVPDEINKYQNVEIVAVRGRFPSWNDNGRRKAPKNDELRFILSYSGASSGTGNFKTRQAAIDWYRGGGR